MARISMTLDHDTYVELERHAKRIGKPRARVIKDMLVEGLARHAQRERRRLLARHYIAGRTDARALLKDLEAPQLVDLLDDEDA